MHKMTKIVIQQGANKRNSLGSLRRRYSSKSVQDGHRGIYFTAEQISECSNIK